MSELKEKIEKILAGCENIQGELVYAEKGGLCSLIIAFSLKDEITCLAVASLELEIYPVSLSKRWSIGEDMAFLRDMEKSRKTYPEIPHERLKNIQDGGVCYYGYFLGVSLQALADESSLLGGGFASYQRRLHLTGDDLPNFISEVAEWFDEGVGRLRVILTPLHLPQPEEFKHRCSHEAPQTPRYYAAYKKEVRFFLKCGMDMLVEDKKGFASGTCFRASSVLADLVYFRYFVHQHMKEEGVKVTTLKALKGILRIPLVPFTRISKLIQFTYEYRELMNEERWKERMQMHHRMVEYYKEQIRLGRERAAGVTA